MISREDREGGVSFVFWAVLAAVVMVVLSFVFMKLQPAAQHYQTETTRQSEQYRSSAETRLLDKVQSWRDIDSKANLYANDPKTVQGFRAQQKALVRQISTEAKRLKADQVPADVNQFISEHPLN